MSKPNFRNVIEWAVYTFVQTEEPDFDSNVNDLLPFKVPFTFKSYEDLEKAYMVHMSRRNSNDYAHTAREHKVKYGKMYIERCIGKKNTAWDNLLAKLNTKEGIEFVNNLFKSSSDYAKGEEVISILSFINIDPVIRTAGSIVKRKFQRREFAKRSFIYPSYMLFEVLIELNSGVTSATYNSYDRSLSIANKQETLPDIFLK